MADLAFHVAVFFVVFCLQGYLGSRAMLRQLKHERELLEAHQRTLDAWGRTNQLLATAAVGWRQCWIGFCVERALRLHADGDEKAAAHWNEVAKRAREASHV